jgi:CheY-like chemotaxis protein
MEFAILLIEDNTDELSRMMLAFMRAAPNVRVCVAQHGEEAQAYLSGVGDCADREAFPIPHVILLDLDLPRNSSFKLLKWLRAEPDLKRIPVIVLTSSVESDDIDLAYGLGANSCLLKTVHEEVIQDIAKGIGDYAALLNGKLFRQYRSPLHTGPPPLENETCTTL